MSYVDDNTDPIERARTRRQAIELLEASDEFIVMARKTGETAIVAGTNVTVESMPYFLKTMQTVTMKLMHAALGAIIDSDEGVEDITELKNHDPLPDPDGIEVPDFLPDDWKEES